MAVGAYEWECTAMAVVEYWSGYFEEIMRLLSNGERQYGIANHDYTD